MTLKNTKPKKTNTLRNIKDRKAAKYTQIIKNKDKL